MTLALWAPFEVADLQAAKAFYTVPVVGSFPRGHSGFVTADPHGHRLLIWSEART